MTTVGNTEPRDEHPGDGGGIVGSWLLQLLAFLAVLAFVAYEVITVVVTTVSLDDTAREVARAARDEYRTTRSLERATQTAELTADLHDARVTSVTTDGDELVVELERQAPTVVVHRLGPLEDLATASSSSRIGWTS